MKTTGDQTLPKLFSRIVATGLLVPSFLLSACGGGGGSGTGDGENARTGMRVVQGALDVAPLDLYQSGNITPIVTQAKFSRPSLYGELPEGQQTVLATRSNRPNDRFTSQQVNVSEGDRFTLLTFGNSEGLGLRSRVLTDAVPELDGRSAIRVVHIVAGAESVSVSSASLTTGVSVSYGGDSGYKLVNPGLTRFAVSRIADGKSLGSVSVELLPGEGYSLFVTGEVDYFTALRVVSDTE